MGLRSWLKSLAEPVPAPKYWLNTVTCPECGGEGGYVVGMDWLDWDFCPVCDGQKTIKVRASD